MMKLKQIISFFGLILIILILIYEVKVLNGIRKNDVELEGWSSNTSRLVYDYLTPNHLLFSSKFCFKESLLLVMVHSKPSNFKARQAIRKTWGRKTSLLDRTSSVYFLIGETSDRTIQYRVFLESEKYDDIIQEPFIDSYFNLTLKSLRMLKLISYCPDIFKYLLKVDDDVFVHQNNIVKMLRKEMPKNLLTGFLFCGSKPYRDPESKWYTPYYMYSEDRYPDYLSGAAYLMSISVAEKIFRKALQTPIFHMEDVYITGICAKEAQIKPAHNHLFLKRRIVFHQDECVLKEIYTVHDLKPAAMVKINFITKNLNLTKKCVKRVEKFSTGKWIFKHVLGIKNNPWGYRKNCQ